MNIFLYFYFILPFLGFSMYQWSRNFSWRTVINEPRKEWSWVSVKEFSCCLTLNRFIKKSAAELISTFMMFELVNVSCFYVERISEEIFFDIFTVFLYFLFFLSLQKKKNSAFFLPKIPKNGILCLNFVLYFNHW